MEFNTSGIQYREFTDECHNPMAVGEWTLEFRITKDFTINHFIFEGFATSHRNRKVYETLTAELANDATFQLSDVLAARSKESQYFQYFSYIKYELQIFHYSYEQYSARDSRLFVETFTLETSQWWQWRSSCNVLNKKCSQNNFSNRISYPRLKAQIILLNQTHQTQWLF